MDRLSSSPRTLWAISDLHVGHEVNRQALEGMGDHGSDWLILGGDLGETVEHVELVLTSLAPKFARLLWIPGNHELWTRGDDLRGEEKYLRLVELCRSFGVTTPEDAFPEWPDPEPREASGRRCVIAPLFLLYDYTFGPEGLGPEEAIAWALEDGVLCADELRLHPHPYSSRQQWCRLRCEQTYARLEALPEDVDTVLVNHFPLRREHAILPAVPRFVPWCGTTRTQDWHRRFRAKVVVGGHLHVRSTRWLDGVRFEEVSLGYPRQWSRQRRIDDYLREILPGPARAHGRGFGVRDDTR